jgi:FkbM family methyltransferase
MKKINLFIGNILLSSFFVNILYFFFFKKYIKFHNFKVLSKNIDKKNYIRLFFNFYEKAEISLVNKYFDAIDTIELGSGIGCVSGLFKTKFKEKFKLIMVEANYENILLARKNFYFNNIKKNFYFLNKIFVSSHKNRFLDFKKNKFDFLQGKIEENSQNKKVKGRFISIDQIIKKFKLKLFNAIIDIEGEEFNFSYRDFLYFKNCQKLVIEIHTHNYVLIKKLLYRFHKISNLRLKDQIGFVYYLQTSHE